MFSLMRTVQLLLVEIINYYLALRISTFNFYQIKTTLQSCTVKVYLMSGEKSTWHA